MSERLRNLHQAANKAAASETRALKIGTAVAKKKAMVTHPTTRASQALQPLIVCE